MTELTPYLAVRGAQDAIAWYVERMGAEVTFDPIVMDDGRVGHVELAVGGAGWMMADEFPEIHAEAPVDGHGASVSLHLAPVDVDGLAERMAAGGALLDRGPEDSGGPAGRVAVLRDPFGHRWFLSDA